MPQTVTAIAAQYLETVNAEYPALGADPLDATHYTQIGIGIRHRALALASAAIHTKPRNDEEAWLQVWMLATLPTRAAEIPRDLVAIRKQLLSAYVERHRQINEARGSLKGEPTDCNQPLSPAEKLEKCRVVVHTSRLVVAYTLLNLPDRHELIQRLLDVVERAEYLLAGEE